ncbi:P-loop ATPase, Sll1717 family [Labrys sp. (in: a-proteobacteria)]|uniref:P-loop ATPase, Sll1717 family n=1 Tax=Labrys sp. (in: a-proteobacteria) TaxID=1917972 RepID=UPI0039E37018
MAKANKHNNPIRLHYGMSIGSNAAESDDEFLFDCFVYHPAVRACQSVESSGMIISARTGAGKTAIIRYISKNSEHYSEIDPLDMAMSYISSSDVVNFLHSIGADLDLLFQILWKHILCLEFIRLQQRVDDEARSIGVFARFMDIFRRDERKRKALEYLKEWEAKFWITADQNVKEITEKFEKKFEAELGGEIRRFKGRGQYDKQIAVDKKTEILSRVRKIIDTDQLSKLSGVIDMLSSISANEQKHYYILIDKLDTNWVDTSLRFRLTRALIETLKTFRRIRNLKIIVGVRSDILERSIQETNDLTFQSEKLVDYFVQIKWSRAQLRELVQKRIRELFRRQYSAGLVEFEDIFQNNVGNANPFDYMIDRTLYRPRDIIEFVNQCLIASEDHFDVSATNIRRAEKEYSRRRREALEQEWRSAFPTLPKLLGFVAGVGKTTFDLSDLILNDRVEALALEIATSNKIDFDPVHAFATLQVEGNRSLDQFVKYIVSILYRVGAIGVKLDPSEKTSYSHINQPLLDDALIPDVARIRIHPMFHQALLLGQD